MLRHNGCKIMPIYSFAFFLQFYSSVRSGTCYTATECLAKNGLATGKCAAG